MYLEITQTAKTTGYTLFCEHIRYNERLQDVLDHLSDFQRDNCKFVLQLGMATLLPIFEGYEEPPIVFESSPHEQQRTGDDELTSLPTDYSDNESTNSQVISTSNESGEEELIILSSSPEAASVQEIDLEQLFNEDHFIIEVEMEDKTIDNSDELLIYLLVPQGAPRYEIAASIGTIHTTKKQRWILKNGACDKGLYQLVMDPTCTQFSYHLHTDVLRQMLINQKQLFSKDSLFDLLEQKKLDFYTQMYIWRDKDVKAMNSRIKKSATIDQNFFPMNWQSTCRSIRWVQKPLPSIQPLDSEQTVFVHLDQKRFLADPRNDIYYSAPSDKYSTGSFDVTFRGFCLAHPSGTGKRRKIAEALASYSNKNVLLICTRTAEEYWQTEFTQQNTSTEQLTIAHWETLHQQTSHVRLNSGDDYYTHFRYLVSESSFRGPQTEMDIPLACYIELLGEKWDLIVLDDAMHGIFGGKGPRHEYWHLQYSPLFKYIQNLSSPLVICTSSDYPTNEVHKVRLMGALLQKPDQLSLLTFKENAGALLEYIMTHVIFKCPRENFYPVLCPLITSVKVLKMDFYETMAQPDYLNRYSSSPMDHDYGQVPSSKLAEILTCPPTKNLYQHQSHYQRQTVYSLEEAEQKLKVLCIYKRSRAAYHLPLLDRNDIVHQTHSSSKSGNSQYLQSLISNKNALVDQFSCVLCLESRPAEENDYVVTPCGHFMCWSCLSPWIHHAKSKFGTTVSDDYITPCLSCKEPISTESIIRYKVPKTEANTASGPPAAKKRKVTKKKVKEEEEITPIYQGLYGAKLQMLIPWLRERCDNHQRIVLFTHHKTYSIDLFGILKSERLPITRYVGAQKDKARIVRMFTKKQNNRPTGRILFLSSSIGYDDMNLSECTDSIVFLDNCYSSPSEQESAENALLGRIQRRNRTRPIEVVRLLLEGTSEERQYKEYTKLLAENTNDSQSSIKST